MFVSAAFVLTVPRRPAVVTLILSTIIQLMFCIGLEPVLLLVGSLNVCVFTTQAHSLLINGRSYFCRFTMSIDKKYQLYDMTYLLLHSVGDFKFLLKSQF